LVTLVKIHTGWTPLTVSWFFRWFALFYLFMMFFLVPLYIFGLSMAGSLAMYIGLVGNSVAIVIPKIVYLISAGFELTTPKLHAP
jgi:hypothetical protein